MFLLLVLTLLAQAVWCFNFDQFDGMPTGPLGTSLPLPPGQPQPLPDYATGHANNEPGGIVPDKHNLSGPYLGSDDQFMSQSQSARIQANWDGYWLSEMGPRGTSPLAPSGYQFFRNVKDFGAVGDGVTDDTAAINRAAAVFSEASPNEFRCDGDCGSTTTLIAVVYFPPGTYLVSSPIMQYYYTQFVSNPEARAVIKGTSDFVGIALIDSNFYYPDGNGKQWYINQSNFFRQIRNFVFDLTAMAKRNYQNGQEYVPTGIHWQVGQATSISNCHFEMPLSDAEGATTAVGIFMENGSGGSVDTLTFFGGNIGFVAGSQQFTATNLRFTLTLTAIKQLWNWGFVYKNLFVQASYIAIDCTEFSASTTPPQGSGSITVLDSHFNGVPYAITVKEQSGQRPSIVLENLLVENSASVVLVSGGATLLAGSTAPQYISSWVSGFQTSPPPSYLTSKRAGFLSTLPNKPVSLLSDGSEAYFYRSKPQYPGTRPLVATDFGVQNDGQGDQTAAINSLLSGNVGSIIFFPGGIYLVAGTVEIPVGSKIIGSGWSTIMGEGSYFADELSPKVMVRVGNPGDSGVIEITDMLFTVRGSTKGCILMEWNVRESAKGSAAMWDSHFRVGGNAGSDLLLGDCPPRSGSVLRECMAAAMLLHLPAQSSGFFDNVWVWVADHDLDDPANSNATMLPGGIPDNSAVELSVYVGRGVLIESQGPTWFYGAGSEHAQLYQWQLLGAKNLFMGHMQTETPYYQSDPGALEPYTVGEWPSDPTFSDCSEDICRKAWALRILNSTDIYLYGLGFYSFFEKYELGCAPEESCQKSLIETNFAGNVWLYNIFTKGNHEIITPRGDDVSPIYFNETTRNGYTSSVAAWLALALLKGADIGQNIDDPTSGSGIVYVDPDVYDAAPGETATVNCFPRCTYVFPDYQLPSAQTFTFPSYTTSVEVGWFTTTTFTRGWGETVTTVTFVRVTHVTVLTPPPTVVTAVPVRQITITPGVTSTDFSLTAMISVPTFIITNERKSTDPVGVEIPPNIRTITPPPWPWPRDEYDEDDESDDELIILPPFKHLPGPPFPPCKGGCGLKCLLFCSLPCLLNCPEGYRDFQDPSDPNSRRPDDESCETATYSSCREFCIAGPPTTCTTSCSDVVGCSGATGLPSTVTPAPAYVNTNEPHIPTGLPVPEDIQLAAAQSMIAELEAQGLLPVGLPLPPLPPDDDDDDDEDDQSSTTAPIACSSSTISVICNGSGGQSACLTSTYCLPPAYTFPTLSQPTGTPTCSNAGDFCYSTQTVTLCARKPPSIYNPLSLGPAQTLGPEPTRILERHIVEEVLQADESSSEDTNGDEAEAFSVTDLEAIASSLHLYPGYTYFRLPSRSHGELDPAVLLARQDPSCREIELCHCATVISYPCLQMEVYVELRLDSIETYAKVVEYGVEVCRIDRTCSFENITDECASGAITCPNGSTMKWQADYIDYESAQFGVRYGQFLEAVEDGVVRHCGDTPIIGLCVISRYTSQFGLC